MDTKNISVIGGDFRSIVTANALSSTGHTVCTFGFDENTEFAKDIKRAASLPNALQDAEIVLLPLPCSTDGETINTSLYTGKIPMRDLVQDLRPDQLVLGGRISKLLSALLEEQGIPYEDYFAREEFTVQNAIPTAEGAIEIAMRELPITLHSAHPLVLGFGRIAKVLAKMLSGIGSRVTIAARKHSDLAWIEAYGYRGMYTNALKEQIHTFDVIFNTVPYQLLTSDLLSRIPKNCLIIDLASKPGGVDFKAAQELGLNVVWALSLPGKVIS